MLTTSYKRILRHQKKSIRDVMAVLELMIMTSSVTICLHQLTVCAMPIFTDFSGDIRRVFQDINNQDAFYHALFIDTTNTSRLYIGALDYVYRLDAEDIRYQYQVSANLTASANYTSTYATSVSNCWQIGNIPHKSVQCRNHVRAVFSLSTSNEIYVCSTGAFSPQEFYLSNSLQVAHVSDSLSSGKNKCPYDPLAVYSAVYVVNGTPSNVSAIYTAVASDSSSGYVTMFRLGLSRDKASSPINLLRTGSDMTWINTADDVYFVATFDIDNYVYYFFRELALESTWLCSKTYYSRVARVCKNDEGGNGLSMTFSFTSFLKARLVCSILTAPSDIPFYFNELYDVEYNATSRQFYALFVTNSDGKWGSGVCQYSLGDINAVFDQGSWVEQITSSSAWTVTKPSDVPSIRPGQCIGSSLRYDTSTLSFIKSHPLMADMIRPTTGDQPLYYNREIVFSQLEVDVINSYTTLLYLYTPELAELHRVSVIINSSGIIQHNVVSIWKPFNNVTTSLPVTVWNMLLHMVNEISWMYLTADEAVVQIKVDQCKSYLQCTDCVLDPYCGWNPDLAVCSKLLQAADRSESMRVCHSYCTNDYDHANVVPGMAIYLNCSSKCMASDEVTWYFQADGSALLSQVAVESDSNYLITRDSGLVILLVNSSQHVGTFQCQSDDLVLTRHQISLSVCEYGETVRDIWIKEYLTYCKAFDEYRAEYSKWRCMQDSCVKSRCIPDAEKCATPTT